MRALPPFKPPLRLFSCFSENGLGAAPTEIGELVRSNGGTGRLTGLMASARVDPTVLADGAGRMSPAGRLPRLLAAAPFRQGEAEVALVPSREGAERREPEQIRNIGEAAFVAFEVAFGKLATHVIHE